MTKRVSGDEVDLGPLPGFVGYLLRRAQLSVFEAYHRRFAALDLRPAEFSLLLVVDRNVGLTQRCLAETLGIRPSNLVGVVARLLARALIEQHASPRDRRTISLRLTASGRVLLAQAMTLARELDREVTAELSTKEREKLLDLLSVLACPTSPASSGRAGAAARPAPVAR